MKTQKVRYFELKGSYKDIGKQMAQRLKAVHAMQCMQLPYPNYISDNEWKEARNMYDRYCPGLMEELEGFSEESGISAEDLSYYWMTYLVPRCSGLLMDDKKTTDGHMKLIRNYEFNIDDEDLTVTKTSPEGKYAHIGGNIACFGRCEGINECGLTISQSSCGIPVSNIQGMRPAKIKGLQFWAAIRTILENCKDVEEALTMLQEMPIAYNINLLIADSKHHGVIFETMDGKKAYQRIDERGYLATTNHIVIPEFQKNEPVGMRNSIIRYKNVCKFAESKRLFSESDMKKFMLTKYPEGMTCYNYQEYFGTIKTVLMDVEELRYSICWFGLNENGWTDFTINSPIKDSLEDKMILMERAIPGMFEMIPIQ